MNGGGTGRFLRTLRHLRGRQIAAQLVLRLQPGRKDPSWAARRRPPAAPPVRWTPATAWLPPGPGMNTAAALHAGRFTFVDDERGLGWPPEWSATDAPLLWRYNLHYLEWLWALPPGERLEAALDWVRRHPPVSGAVGWEPYPTSLRLPTLCLLAAGEGAEALWPSVWTQAEHLSRRLEHHLLGNHLLENGVALAFAGACFAGPDAERWLRTGTDVLSEQLPEQILPDGMHFERSPMYQIRLTHALAMVANTGNPGLRALVAEPLRRMRSALLATCHPDGDVALFNDAAFGIYPAPEKVASFAADVLGIDRAGDVPASLPDAGYFTGRGPAGDAVFCDAGPLGPDYLPGHAHGDIFSFELSLAGRRAVVDSGTYDYVPSEMRRYCRSTAAHNTVTVEDADQAEFWGAFRVGRRGRPHDVRHAPRTDGFELSGWHDGFRHLRHRPVHRRTFRWHDEGTLAIEDEVTATGPVTATSRLYLHPDCRIVGAAGTEIRVAVDDVHFAVTVTEGPSPRLAEGWYCPRFGVRQRNRVIVLEARGTRVRFAFAIARCHGPSGSRATPPGGGPDGA